PSRTTPLDRTNIDFAVASGFISGRVTDGAAGVAGITVQAGTFSAATDNNGYYRIETLPPGNYSVSPLVAGYGFTPAQISASLGATNVNFTVTSYPVSGRITELQSNGVGGVTISVSGLTNQATSDLNGDFLIPGVPPSTRTI